MKDCNQETLEYFRPGIDVQKAVRFCLGQLYASKTKCLADDVCERLTYEELIGALLLAQDYIEETEAAVEGEPE